MIVALLNRKGGVGKTTLALHLAGAWARQGRRVTLIDADLQGSGLDWTEQWTREGLPAPFRVVGVARDTLHREAPAIADHVVIDGPRIAAVMRSALLASDLALLPVQPSPFDGWASAETLTLIDEARSYRRRLAARFVLNRCTARTVIARETAAALADHDPPMLRQRIGQRLALADAAKNRSTRLGDRREDRARTILSTCSGSSTADQRSTANIASVAPHRDMPSAWDRCADGKLPLGLLSRCRDLSRAIDARTAAQARNRHATLLPFWPGGVP
jgi:chromosome partitioning protein